MRARIPQPLRRLRPAPARRGGERAVDRRPAPAPSAAAAPAQRSAGPEARVRQAGGPEDVATYTCGCGVAFTAAVSTSVACPHCGAGQDW